MELGEQFVAALRSNDPVSLSRILSDRAGLRLYRWDGSEAYRPRERVARRLLGEWASWSDPTIEHLGSLSQPGSEPGAQRLAVEFRIQATEQGRYVEHNRAAFLTVREGQIEMIDLYCAEPVPSARRKGWIAPESLTDPEIEWLFESIDFLFDIREWLPPSANGRLSLRLFQGGSEDPHPGSNSVRSVHWTSEEAEARIEAILDYYRRREVGFTWFVGPKDTPTDLGARLVHHGLIWAGDQAVMARRGLKANDIPINPDVEIEVLDGSQLEAFEAALRIVATAFHWTPDQVAERRKGMLERLQDPRLREHEIHYLARLGGEPVGEATLLFRGGIAYLGGASTLPEFRSRRVYSTLLRRRLEAAHDRGYHLAAIHAEPMSRRVVSKYGFREFARVSLYAWMPVPDLAVIRSLVPDE